MTPFEVRLPEALPCSPHGSFRMHGTVTTLSAFMTMAW